MQSHFVDIGPAEVARLRDSDTAISAINGLQGNGGGISFNWLKRNFRQQNGTQHQLDRGRAVLSTTDQLNQYLYSHGLMIESQWNKLPLQGSRIDGRIRLVDHGCGQGLAGLLLFDRFGDALFKNVAKIVLIEPSKVALVRAEAIYRCIAPQSPIICVNCGFDDLVVDHLKADGCLESVHLFSNVLDVEGFDQFALFNKALTNGKHTFIVVSHDRAGYGGSDRILKLKREIEDPKYQWLSVLQSEIVRFQCDNPSQSDAISWMLQVDVNRG